MHVGLTNLAVGPKVRRHDARWRFTFPLSCMRMLWEGISYWTRRILFRIYWARFSPELTDDLCWTIVESNDIKGILDMSGGNKDDDPMKGQVRDLTRRSSRLID